MTKKILFFIAVGFLAAGAALLLAQQSDILSVITGGTRIPAIAAPDFKGAGDAGRFMPAFNATLFSELEQSGRLQMVAKSLYPLEVPQQPSDFKAPEAPARRGEQPRRVGPWLTDWFNPPVNANYLAFGYTAVQDGRLVLFGWLYNVGQPDIASAQVVGKVYTGSLDDDGARKVARDFAADILTQFGAVSLAGSRIHFVSDRTGNKEIWSMDYDGSNQKQLTNFRSITTMPSVSPDGRLVACTTFARGQPEIVVLSAESGRRLTFYNQRASMNANASFTPDSKHVIFSSTAAGDGYANIYMADVNGGNLRRLTQVRAVEVEPKVNPKTGQDVVFVSGRSGPPQVYRMNIEGTDIGMLTTGEGDAVNPAWHPDGKFIAFAWTRGFEPGNFNIFVMNVATRQLVQLTSGQGRNENPVWAPDGVHLAYSSRRGGRTSIFTMLADGTQQKQLTSQGNNEKPVWAKAIQ
ncbi:MAG: hypothetical protein K2X35_02140 [Bryobacteraceae bacterium]|nr:hypothetical protein [Bryobacteraceae bacterium]